MTSCEARRTEAKHADRVERSVLIGDILTKCTASARDKSTRGNDSFPSVDLKATLLVKDLLGVSGNAMPATPGVH